MAKGAAISRDSDLTYLQVRKHTGKPLGMCKITVSGCVKFSEVIFTDDDNGFIANLPDPNSAWDDWEKYNRYTSINRAFADFVFSTRSISCSSSYSKGEQADKKLVATCRISG
ncbi:hypothetical protein IT774_10370 [Salinimonas marina]|uniref:Uncharacterized protein n=1 Tax=Salinimonas marina TaxID=2785918 RepID=A0A7S9HCM9_9ALTE|nr:hypothetical protein [Salinimonas marina]QPG04636.1 hypothetical protein IT774_10370 [Salinimonas marina]